MLREVTRVKQDVPALNRRWYRDDYFDLWTWQDARGEFVAFQLSVERRADEKALTWREEFGFDFLKVGPGEWPGTRGQMQEDAGFFAPGVKRRLRAAAKTLPVETRRFVLARLREYLEVEA